MGINFSGAANDRNSSGYAPNFLSTDSFGLCFWAKFNAFPTGATENNTFGSLSGTGAIIQLTFLSDAFGSGKPTLIVKGDGGGQDLVIWSTALSTGVWYHILLNYVTGSGGMGFYINAVGQAGANGNSGGQDKNLSTRALAFAARNNAGSIDTPSNVVLDEVYIWRTNIDGYQTILYGNGAPVRGIGLTTYPTNLEFYQPYNDFTDGSDADGDTTVDKINTANNGLVNKGSGTATWDNTSPVISTVFRKTFSDIGTGVGKRQIIGDN